ncbi:hypothetical protein SORBI_3009G183101 [Sorghum bicolor]|uniref:Uncharacterized protein n=1 Tax=Sorghum bicolor TaxID=4558 RepID=A0A1Z5R377_SORBI|nr:hypothetical protein SORBI_3009G183101 [Sorghum bicolor]
MQMQKEGSLLVMERLVEGWRSLGDNLHGHKRNQSLRLFKHTTFNSHCVCSVSSPQSR